MRAGDGGRNATAPTKQRALPIQEPDRKSLGEFHSSIVNSEAMGFSRPEAYVVEFFFSLSTITS